MQTLAAGDGEYERIGNQQVGGPGDGREVNVDWPDVLEHQSFGGDQCNKSEPSVSRQACAFVAEGFDDEDEGGGEGEKEAEGEHADAILR